jgi:hypothetical protein
MSSSFALTLPRAEEPVFSLDSATIEQLSSSDLNAAIAYLETMAPADRKYASATYQKWAENDPAKAVKAFQALYPRDESFEKEQFMYSHAIRQILIPAITKDPPTVAAAVLDLDPKTRAEVLYDIGKSWCQTDGAAAAAWAAKLPEDPYRDESLRQFISAWAVQDSSQTTAFVDALPAGSGKFAAAEGLATGIFPTDPDAALAWIRTIPDEKERLAALQRAYLPWRKTSGSPKVLTWRDTSPNLSEQERAAIADGNVLK